MKSGDKKTEKSIVKALTDVCETCKNELSGFSWLTHFVDYSQFPQSLKIVIVFDTTQNLENAKHKSDLNVIKQHVHSNFLAEGVVVKSLNKALFFDSEENGADINNRKWERRFTG